MAFKRPFIEKYTLTHLRTNTHTPLSHNICNKKIKQFHKFFDPHRARITANVAVKLKCNADACWRMQGINGENKAENLNERDELLFEYKEISRCFDISTLE